MVHGTWALIVCIRLKFGLVRDPRVISLVMLARTFFYESDPQLAKLFRRLLELADELCTLNRVSDD